MRPESIFISEPTEYGEATLEGYIVHVKDENWKNFLEGEAPSIAKELCESVRAQSQENLPTARVAILKHLVVPQEDRGMGHGDSLMNRFFSEHQFDVVFLAADVVQEQKHGFNLVKWFESFGFEPLRHSETDVLVCGWSDNLINFSPFKEERPQSGEKMKP